MKNWMSEGLKILSRKIVEVSEKCRFCDSATRQIKTKANTVQCKWIKCRKYYNVFEGTPFKSAKLTLEEIITVIKMWCVKINARAISEVLEIEEHVIYRLIKKIERKLKKSYENMPQSKIGGPGIIVEIDESKFGKVKYHRGHREGGWVFGMVERTPERRVVLVKVENRTKLTLEKLLIEYVHDGSIIYSDCWKAYSRLSEIFMDHKTVNHSLHFVDPNTNVHTNTIERTWFGVKQQVSNGKKLQNL